MAVLEPQLLISAYCQGYFPMGMENGEIRWFLPEWRGILPVADFHVPARFVRYLKHHPFEVRWNTAFTEVMRGCADRDETWITEDIIKSYEALHDLGHAHSAEVWREGNLVGGVYGVAIGGAFFGESMFSRETQASKVALVALQRRLKERGFIMHDTQWTTPHLASFGGHEIPCDQYLKLLQRAIRLRASFMGSKTEKVPLKRVV
ncbi:MAG: aat [Verrucomicrobiaceae bacterium]|nr:aat [Verrucomicrobiaceae bacterium]